MKILNTDIGKRGEKDAVLHLIKNNYQILVQNYRYKRAEIDIIAQAGDVLVFVEVKNRKNTRFGYPEDFVSDAQIDRIQSAAENYMLENNYIGKIRFDIIAIIAQQEIRHIVDAF